MQWRKNKAGQAMRNGRKLEELFCVRWSEKFNNVCKEPNASEMNGP